MLSMLKLGEDKALVVEEVGRGVVKPKVPSNVYLLVSQLCINLNSCDVRQYFFSLHGIL